jgi:HSP20 family protein
MKLARYTPSSLARVTDFDEWLRNPFAGFPAAGPLFDLGRFFGGAPATQLATDVYEDTDNYFARFELPGVKKEDVKLELHERLLTVNVERREKVGETEQTYTLTRSVAVPDTVLADDITAKLEDGLLTVTLPKQEERKPRTISVN